MAWEQVLSDLADLFASLIRDPAEAETVVQRIGLRPEDVRIYGQRPSVFWMNIVEEARNQQSLDNLIEYGKKRYPKVDFPALVQAAASAAPQGPKPDDDRWQVPAEQGSGLERIIGTQSTLLPISFLELGVLRARSVAK